MWHRETNVRESPELQGSLAFMRGRARITDGAPPSREDEVPPQLYEFFRVPDNFAVLRIANSSSPPISLRALSWFVSNGIEDAATREDYERNLRKFTRRKFDPFRRCDRKEIELAGETVVTTVGQMNFFKWMIERGLWQFVSQNRAKVSAEVARRSVPRPSTPGAECGAAQCAPGFSQVCGRHIVIFD